MKIIFRLFIVLLVIAGVCIISCPKHEEHQKSIMNEVKTRIDKEIYGAEEGYEENTLSLIATTLYSGISEKIIKNKLQVENYFLFSIGRIMLDGESEIISFGILNHVFTDLPDELKEKLDTL